MAIVSITRHKSLLEGVVGCLVDLANAIVVDIYHHMPVDFDLQA
jgi:hypothetical protein